ncbi:helix-turn-helix domain-containing protein [Aliifodinibius salicampi]|uniref:Helix-turn-helix domain-containing protein n=1 Tax=Fodinibius salicampi TaxID=1920655 RepID=A0ABT3PZU7_9BACT|nr:helix-turn-helix domain-containing protein [Fodinibius salicampi]MCW9713361.1 helix-turn-helix domain-containing protein [Fodinibius salicampi]
MQAYIPTKEDLEEIISRKVKETVNDVLPGAIRKATRKEWLTTDEVMEMLQCSRRHVQYLRDSKQLPYSQNGRTIRYHIEDVEAFLNRHKVE